MDSERRAEAAQVSLRFVAEEAIIARTIGLCAHVGEVWLARPRIWRILRRRWVGMILPQIPAHHAGMIAHHTGIATHRTRIPESSWLHRWLHRRRWAGS